MIRQSSGVKNVDVGDGVLYFPCLVEIDVTLFLF